MNDKLSVVVCLCAVGGCVGLRAPPAIACMIPTPPPDPPPRVFTDRHSPTDFWVWVELRDVFDSAGQTHACSCGLGLANPLPPGITLGAGIEIGYYDLSLMQITDTIPQFAALAPNARSTQGWAAGPSVPDALTGSPMVDNWAGFGAMVPPVSPRPLAPNEIFVMCFQLSVPASFAVTETMDAQIGGGLAEDDLAPMFGMRPDPDSHLASYSSVFQFPIPAPGFGALLVVGSLIAMRRRR